jgi:DNA-binding NarL/FixJ family response regulator
MHIRLLLACRDPGLAAALCTNLVSASGGAILGEPLEISSVLDRVAALQPHVVILEHVSGEQERTWKSLAQIERLSPGTRVLLLCDSYTHRTIIGSVKLGAKGCLLKSTEPWLCAKAVKTVHQGQPWFGRAALLEAICRQMAPEPASSSTPIDEHKVLTSREREVLTLAGSAMSNKEIARELNISDQTVKTHLHKIYVKLQTSGRYKLFLSNGPAKSLRMPAAPLRLQ